MTFEEFVDQQGTALLRLTRVLTDDHHAGQDLAQTALVHAYRHWRRVSASDDPQAYPRRIAANAHIDATRRRSSTESVGRQDDVASAHRHEGCTAPAADVPMIEREDLRARLAALPPRAREVLVLRYYADFDDEAIASAMGTSCSSVRATASRALAALRQSSTPPTHPLPRGDDRGP